MVLDGCPSYPASHLTAHKERNSCFANKEMKPSKVRDFAQSQIWLGFSTHKRTHSYIR